jgi:hypothetical protein
LKIAATRKGYSHFSFLFRYFGIKASFLTLYGKEDAKPYYKIGQGKGYGENNDDQGLKGDPGINDVAKKIGNIN